MGFIHRIIAAFEIEVEPGPRTVKFPNRRMPFQYRGDA